MDNYPHPRYPRLKRINSVEDLMPMVRHLVHSPAQERGSNYLPQTYGITRGDRVLFVPRSSAHPWVVEAICRAIREVGGRVDTYTFDFSPVESDPEAMAAHEIHAMNVPEIAHDDFNYYYTLICNTIRVNTCSYLAEKEKYTKVIAGSAGSIPSVAYPWHRLHFDSLEEFASGQVYFPYELQQAIDNKVWAQIRSCARVRFTDPEGTDFSFTNYDDHRVQYLNHEPGKPMYLNIGGTEDCTGVISGTLNHLAAFPRITARIENGLVVEVQGGGKYGDAWRQKLKELNSIILPSRSWKLDRPGFFWFFEMAIGTVPGCFRLPTEGRFECFANTLHERSRAGVVHHGFGSLSTEWWRFARLGIPWIHCHIHSNFATYEGVTKDGAKIKVIDKGHLTALDDPDIRRLAAKFGDPEELLSETWVPAIPGINTPGSYERDYAPNPAAWIRKETEEHPYFYD